MQDFSALWINNTDGYTAEVRNTSRQDLPQGEVLVRVHYSAINYKDALAITGKGKILRDFPAIPGIDFAGEVVESTNPDFRAGAKVLLTGWGVGERHFGGLSQYARVPGKWLLPLPPGLDYRKAMIAGTAGLTAALCVQALLDSGISKGSAVVSGSSGGVGSFAVALLSILGFEVSAISKSASAEYVRSLGASSVLTREQMSEAARPLEKSCWHGAVDTVGGDILSRILAQMHYGGCVAACGLAASHKLSTTVMPFILRGVRLQGCDSVKVDNSIRESAWNLLADLPSSVYDTVASDELSLEQTPAYSERMLSGQVQGRSVVKLS